MTTYFALIGSSRGIGVDSPAMFDDVARGALSFATNDKEIDDDDLDFDDEGFIVTRRR